MEFKTAYSCIGKKKGITFTEPSRTKQSMKDECDINLILKRYQATGVISHVSSMQPVYADVSNFGTYQDALSYIQRADEAFMALPSELRKKLDDNPQNLVRWIKDPANKDEAIRLGVFRKPEKIVEPRVVDTTPTPSPQSTTPTPSPES